jgi:hypothetical protein
MSYSIFKKLGREDDELMKTNLTLNGVGCNPMESRGVVSMELLEHDLIGTETHLSDLLLDTNELSWQHEHHVDIHVGWWQRPVLNQRRLVIIQ